MAQQTQMDRVVPYFNRFLAQFPDVAALAAADEDAVLVAWEGLGYYSRARHLHAAAKKIMTQSLPYAYRMRIRQVTGVETVAAGSWFGGIYIDEKHFFANLAIEAEDFFTLYPEIVTSPEEARAFVQDRKGALVGVRLAERFHWKPGDTITLRGTIYPGQWPMTIRAVYRAARPGIDESTLYLHWSYLDETLKKTMGCRCLTRQKYGQAIIAFKKAININDLFAEAYKGLADAYKGKGEIEECKRYLQKAAEIHAQFNRMGFPRLGQYAGGSSGCRRRARHPAGQLEHRGHPKDITRQIQGLRPLLPHIPEAAPRPAQPGRTGFYMSALGR